MKLCPRFMAIRIVPSSDRDRDFAVHDLHGMRGDTVARCAADKSGRDIKFEAVCATGYDLALKLSRCQRCALVNTGIIDRIDLPLDIEESDVFACDVHD